MKNLATGDLIKLGSLYIGGSLKPRPTRPWQTGSTTTGLSGNGDIQGFSAGQSIEIRDTVATDTYKLRWMEVNTMTGKKLLISDRVILTNVSWDDLNAQSLIFGKEVTIDGKRCRLRVMTGSASPIASNMGGATQNEWDMYIGNTSGLPGLLTPTTADNDGRMMASDAASVHNKNWNWYYVYSWCQETYASFATARVLRGCLGARYWTHTAQSNRGAHIGWRPVLEILDSAPVISGPSAALGNKTAPFSMVYSVSEPENQAFSIKEKINGVVKNTMTGLTSTTQGEVTLDISTWNSLPLNQGSTITVEATDAAGNTTTRTWTFTKTNSAPVASIVEPRGTEAATGIVETLTPVIVHRFDDEDENEVQTAYQYVIESVENGTVVHDTGKVTSTQSFFSVPASLLEWAKQYKFKVRIWDKSDAASEYTEYQFLTPNRPPTATDLSPGSNDKAAPAGTGNAPEFTWTFTDLDMEAQDYYQLQIKKAADDNLVYNTGKVRKNLQAHAIPEGTLANGEVYYAILTVWDVNGLSATTEKAYFQTNNTPTTPTPSDPVDNYRTPLKPEFSALIGTDAENNGMHFAIQICKMEDFSADVLEYNSKVERTGWKVDGVDIPDGGVENTNAGKKVTYTAQVDLERNNTYYWRVAGVDALTGAKSAWSTTRRIRVGNVLSGGMKHAIDTGGVAAQRMMLAIDYKLATDGETPAAIKVEVCNNGNDAVPTWENATTDFLNQEYYTFTNSQKTAATFGVSIRITIEANDSMDEISISSFGLLFD